ncbi:MAG: TlpA family protein disulfide reductase [Niabella sp.]
MKQYLNMLPYVVIGVCVFGISLTALSQKSISITGALDRKKTSEVKLFKVVDGAPKIIATSQPNNEAKFGFQFYPDYEGLYLLGIGTELAPFNNYKFWLKPGDKLSLILNDSSYTLTGKANSKENKALTQWHDMSYLLEKKSVYFMRGISTYVDFFPELDKVLSESETWLASQKKTRNKYFDGMLSKIVNTDIALFANTLLNTPRTAHPDLDELPAYYGNTKVKDLFKNTEDVYFYPWGIRLLNGMMLREMIASKEKSDPGLSGLINTINKFAPDNDTLKGDFAIQYGGRLRDYGEYLVYKDSVGKYLLTDNQLAQDFEIASKLASFKPGDPGFEFKFEDNKGKMVSFADLKGKVVLVDMWATWCGPCKVQIPHLKKLEEEMKDKEVAIVSISVDEEEDKEKWKKMIEEQELGGIQLFAKGWSEMTKFYRITGIPRFMVFDKNGKIVTVDAPRPSTADLKPLLEKYLKK